MPRAYRQSVPPPSASPELEIADSELRRTVKRVRAVLFCWLAIGVAIGLLASARGAWLAGATLVAMAAGSLVAVGGLDRLFDRVQRRFGRRLEAAGEALAEATAKRRRANARASAGERAKSEFLAVMSHEVRTPLNGVIGMTSLLKREPLSPRQQEYVGIIRDSGEALLSVFNGILEFAQNEASKLELEVAEFELRRAVEDVHDLLDPRATEKGLHLRQVFARGMPSRLVGDVERLREILLHLVDNAIKFTPRGEVVTAVTLVDDDGSRATLRFEVEDRGIGIAEELRERLFEPFEQADSSMSRRFGGSGLGLAIARRLVALLGGEMGVDSEPGRGSTFWFSVSLAHPRQRVQQPGDGETANAAKLPAATLPAAQTAARFAYRLSPDRAASDHVLVVEDNDVSRTVTARQLDLLGYRADFAGNGREAIELSRRIAYAAVLMDCQMPVMSGFEATAVIRELERGGRRTPIIALTANALAGDRQRAVAAGMDDYLVKPVALDPLDEALERWYRPSENDARRHREPVARRDRP